MEASTKPVTVKIRTGWNDKSKNCLEVAKIIEMQGLRQLPFMGEPENNTIREKLTGKP